MSHKLLQEGVVYVSDADIVPDDYQVMLIHYSDMYKYAAFEIGDIANNLIKRAAKQGFVVTAARVYEAVGRFCDRSGRTVRYYAEAAAFFPKSVRDEYEMLPFSHFSFARRVGEQWHDVLEYAAYHPSVSVSSLRVKFIRGEIEELDDVYFETEPEEDEEDVENVPTPSREKTHVCVISSYARSAILSSLSTVVDNLYKLLPLIPNDSSNTQLRDQLANILKDMQRLIPKVAEAIDSDE